MPNDYDLRVNAAREAAAILDSVVSSPSSEVSEYASSGWHADDIIELAEWLVGPGTKVLYVDGQPVTTLIGRPLDDRRSIKDIVKQEILDEQADIEAVSSTVYNFNTTVTAPTSEDVAIRIKSPDGMGLLDSFKADSAERANALAKEQDDDLIKQEQDKAQEERDFRDSLKWFELDYIRKWRELAEVETSDYTAKVADLQQRYYDW